MDRPLVTLLALTLMLSAGCVTVPGGTLAEDGREQVRAGWLAPDMTLGEAPPAEGAVATGGFFSAWANGDDYPTWKATPTTQDLRVDSVSVRLFARVTGPVLHTGVFPDFMVYAGGGDSWLGFGQAAADPVLLPDRTYRFDIDVALPPGGLWVPAGESFGIKVVPVMFQESANDVELLMGQEASTVDWREVPLRAAPRPADIQRASGELAGSAYAGEAAPESTRARVPFTVPEGAGALVAWMNVTDHSGVPDVDLALEAPDGTQLAFSGTPTPFESIKLAAPSLPEPGEYAFVVVSYGSARAAWSLEWAVE